MTKTAVIGVCLGLILALAMVADVRAACDALNLEPCLDSGKTGDGPSMGCCTAVQDMGQGAAGAACLCSLATGDLAKQYQVNPTFAMEIPQKCGFAVPAGTECNGSPVPGG